MIRRSFVVFLSVGLVSCATLDKDDCLSADWQLIGFNDGAAGYETKRLEQHRDACAEYGVVPQIDDYLQGYDRGVIRYCTAVNGYATARAGQVFNAVCSGDLRPAFAYGFELGVEAHRQVERLADAEERLKELKAAQHADKHALNQARDALLTDEHSSGRRARLLDDVRSLDRAIHFRALHIMQQQHEVDREARYLTTLEADLRSQL